MTDKKTMPCEFLTHVAPALAATRKPDSTRKISGMLMAGAGEPTVVKTWGVARFYGMGSMQYMLESGEWLEDRKLFDGAPIVLFATMEESDARAALLHQAGQPHGVQFMVDNQGRVLTSRRNK